MGGQGYWAWVSVCVDGRGYSDMAVVEGRGCSMDVMNNAVEVDGSMAQSAIQEWRHVMGLMSAVGGGASGCRCLGCKLAFTCGHRVLGCWV